MTLGDLIDQARIRLDDLNADFLNEEEDLIRFANNGVNEICRRALLIKDSSTTEIVELVLAEDVKTYDLDDRILFIERAGYDGNRLKRIALERLDTIWNWENISGSPNYFCTDYEDGKALIYPTPRLNEDGHIVKLTVYRLPLADMSSTSDVPEIPPEYHHGILYWMCYEALRRQDIDLEALQKSQAEYAAFEQLFGQPKNAAIFAVSRRRFPGDLVGTLVNSGETQAFSTSTKN